MWENLWNKAKSFLGLSNKKNSGWTATGLLTKAKNFLNKGRNFLNNRQNQSLINDVSDLVGGQKVNFDNVNNRLDGVNDMIHTTKNYQNLLKKGYNIGNNIINGDAIGKNYNRYVEKQKSMIHPSRKDRHSSLEKAPRPEPEEINKEQDYIQHPSGGKMYFST